MKDVQNNFNLTSYKLDSVSGKFIRGGIDSIEKLKETNILKCASINDINVDDYIILNYLKFLLRQCWKKISY